MSNRRRLVLSLGAGMLGAPFAGLTQQSGKTWRIGFLGTASAAGYVREVEWIRGGLRSFGYVEGKNVLTEYRWADGDPAKIDLIAAELVALKVDAIVTHGIPGTLAAARATSTIPIVMADGSDPVVAGFAVSLARPGGNVTGSASFVPEETAKRIELMKEIVPRMKRIAFLVSDNPPVILQATRKAIEGAAASMKISLRDFVMREPVDLPLLFDSMAKPRVDALLINNEPLLNAQAALIGPLAAAKRIPSIGNPSLLDSGVLLGYGADRQVLYMRVGYFLDRIFKGTRAGDIPFERASKFQLGVNLKTAKAIGIKLPQQILARADRVIE